VPEFRGQEFRSFVDIHDRHPASVTIETLFASSQEEPLPEVLALAYYLVGGAERSVFE